MESPSLEKYKKNFELLSLSDKIQLLYFPGDKVFELC